MVLARSTLVQVFYVNYSTNKVNIINRKGRFPEQHAGLFFLREFSSTGGMYRHYFIGRRTFKTEGCASALPIAGLVPS